MGWKWEGVGGLLEAVSEGEDSFFTLGVFGYLVDEFDGELGIDCGWVWEPAGSGLLDFFVAALTLVSSTEGDGRDASFYRGIAITYDQHFLVLLDGSGCF